MNNFDDDLFMYEKSIPDSNSPEDGELIISEDTEELVPFDERTTPLQAKNEKIISVFICRTKFELLFGKICPSARNGNDAGKHAHK